MIDLYTWPTPNGRKIHIMLEETGLSYVIHPVNTRAGDQFKPEYLKINPNNKIPAIIDSDGPEGAPYTLFESGAILIYLAEKSGRFLPATPAARYRTLQWLMFQVSGVGPMFGQASHFRAYSKDEHRYSIERYTNEVRRLHRVLDRRLGETRYLAGDDYTIADIATFPWILNGKKRGADLADFRNVRRWHDEIEARPAVKQGLALMSEARRSLDAPPTDAERDVMFGAQQYGSR